MNQVQKFNDNLSKGNLYECQKIFEKICSNIEYKHLFNDMLWNYRKYINILDLQLIYNLKNNFIDKTWYNINPFIVRDVVTQDVIIGIRVVNYASNDGKNGVDFRNLVITKYEIFIFSPDMLNLKNNFALNVKFNDCVYKRDYFKVKGTEDYRVINVPGNNDLLKAVCTSIEAHPSGPVRMCMFDIFIQRNVHQEIINLHADNLVPLTNYNDHVQQKNWIPIYIDNNLHMIYSCAPIILLKVQSDGKCDEINKVDNNLYLCKNSTIFLPFEYIGEQCYLTIIHNSADNKSDLRRIYTHRFLVFNKNFNLIAKSDIFCFRETDTIEFASGLIYDCNKENIIITYGSRDREAHISTFSLRRLNNLLHKV